MPGTRNTTLGSPQTRQPILWAGSFVFLLSQSTCRAMCEESRRETAGTALREAGEGTYTTCHTGTYLLHRPWMSPLPLPGLRQRCWLVQDPDLGWAGLLRIRPRDSVTTSTHIHQLRLLRPRPSRSARPCCYYYYYYRCGPRAPTTIRPTDYLLFLIYTNIKGPSFPGEPFILAPPRSGPFCSIRGV
ncbi:hypothetical protein B0T20DRAFT_78637 [Sordaria brevicollis]|uniref:Uncharacterized protein n=1 Tax=Sordaria brevicollis TaxID=83679 RepID=A0AAE0P192_SORBR|nr:hypothetical protein B0T20DRAFT_78637 [Sordaria brevicollis]